MRIHSYNGFPVNQPSSKNKASSVSVPDFFVKKEPKMSDEKFREAITQQAQRDAPTGKFGVDCPGFKNLMDRYVSVVSPDRKGIIDKALATPSSIYQGCIPDSV